MSEFIHYPETGTLFKNKKKTEDSHADLQGACNITQPGHYWMNVWANKQPDGSHRMRVTFRLKDHQPATAPAPQAPPQSDAEDTTGDLPW